ncbi:MAG: 2-amino-4-hydroxy-6-hydroxymethyldihydropteridine diphosphokinase [Pseudomonadota bacterium]
MAECWWPAYIGVGSNLDAPLEQVNRAVAWLTELPDCAFALASSRYASAPLGPRDQPDFVNAVVGLLTRLSPEDLLKQLQALEQCAGRRRDGERWGPRTLDLDLLVYAACTSDAAALTLPHPGIAERAFVTVPLAEIAPSLAVPRRGTAAALARAHAGVALRCVQPAPSG